MASTVTAEVTGLGIAQDKDGRGMDALTHRRIIEGDWESEGIVTGLAATANPGKGMSWHIAEGVAVTKRSDADGMAVVYWPGGDVTGETGGDEARTDFLWIRQLDAAQGDSSNRVSLCPTPTAWPDPYWKKGKTRQKRKRQIPRKMMLFPLRKIKRCHPDTKKKQIFPQRTEI